MVSSPRLSASEAVTTSPGDGSGSRVDGAVRLEPTDWVRGFPGGLGRTCGRSIVVRGGFCSASQKDIDIIVRRPGTASSFLLLALERFLPVLDDGPNYRENNNDQRYNELREIGQNENMTRCHEFSAPVGQRITEQAMQLTGLLRPNLLGNRDTHPGDCRPHLGIRLDILQPVIIHDSQFA